jgi:poly-gamma-glutamate synthesis protein (capsule biosynthesis protein)
MKTGIFLTTHPKVFFTLLTLYCQCFLVHSQELTLLFAGDAMQHQLQLDHARQGKDYDYSSYFRYLQEEVSAADLAIVNLEVTLGGKPYTGYPMFSAPDEYAVALKNAGFDVFLTANNHCLDRFSAGLERTIRVLDSLQVIHTGTFRNSIERYQQYPNMITRHGIRLALLNYTYDTNGIHPVLPNIVNYIDDKQLLTDIAEAKELNADFIIVAMHWGVEYKLVQNKEQERLARLLTEAGADLVIGSHPHVVQPTIVSKNDDGSIRNIVVYSLGNFVSAMKAPNTYGGQLFKVVLSKNQFHKQIKDCTYSLIYVNKPIAEGNIRMEVLPVPSEIPSGATNDTHINYKEMEWFARTARELFNTYNQHIKENTFDLSTYQKNYFPVSFWNM